MYLQMAKKLTEDAVRDKARDILGFKDKDGVRSGVGQITTFNQINRMVGIYLIIMRIRLLFLKRRHHISH